MVTSSGLPVICSLHNGDTATGRVDPGATTAAAATPSATDIHALGRDWEESAPLQRQSEELRADSAALLDRTGLGPGQAATDPGSMANSARCLTVEATINP